MQIDCLHKHKTLCIYPSQCFFFVPHDYKNEQRFLAVHSIFWLVFLMETECVYCETGADFIWQYPLIPCVPLPVMALSANWLSPAGCNHCQQMQSSCSGLRPKKAIQTTSSHPSTQNRTSVFVSKIPFIVTGFPYHKPSDSISVHIWLNKPRDFDLRFVQVLAISTLFGLSVWLPW
jgi:hypothetical protein